MISLFVPKRQAGEPDVANHHILRPNFTPGLISNFTGQYGPQHQSKSILSGLRPHELLVPNFGCLEIALCRSLNTLHPAV